MAHTAMFDTLHYANKLKAAGISDEHAQVQAETLAEVLEESHRDIVTKADLLATKVELKAETEQFRSDLLATKSEIAIKLADINVKFAEVYRAIAENKNEIVKWFVGISAGQIALIFTMLKFVH